MEEEPKKEPVGNWEQDPYIPECDRFVHAPECECEECYPELDFVP
jgi:hypothetical protein